MANSNNQVKGLVYTAEFDGKTFVGSVNDMNKLLRATKGELKLLDQALKLDPTNIELMIKKSESLNDAISLSEKRAEGLKDQLAELKKEPIVDAKTLTKIKNLEKEILSTETSLKKMKSEKINIKAQLSGNARTDLDDIEEELNKIDNTTATPEVNTEGVTDKISALKDKIEATGLELPLNIGGGIDTLTSGLKALPELLNPVTLGVAGLAVAATAMWKGFEMTAEVDSAMTKLENQLGLTEKQTEALTQTARNIYQKGYGESLDDVTEKVAQVKQTFQGLNNVELSNISKQAIALTDTFDVEMNEVLRSANSLMKNFNVSGEEALSAISYGLQNGMNVGDDFLDTLNEYSVQFAKNGESVESFMGKLDSGLKSGTYNTDKLADAWKEFNNKMIGGDSEEVIKSLGLNFKQLQKDVAGGGDKAVKAQDKIVEALKKVKNPAKQASDGVAIFGTMWEDVGGKAILASQGVKISADDMKKSIDGITKNSESGISGLFDNITRGVPAFFSKLGQDMTKGVNRSLEGAQKGDPLKFLEGLFGTGESLGDAIGSLLGKGLAWITNPANQLKLLVGIGGGLLSLASGIIAGLLKGLVLGFGEIKLDDIQKAFDDFMKGGIKNLVNIGTWINDVIKKAPDAIAKTVGGWATGLANSVTKTFSQAITGLSKFGTDIALKIATAPTQINNQIKKWASSLGKAIGDTFKKAISVLSNFGSWIWNQISSGFSWVTKKIGDFFGNLNPFRMQVSSSSQAGKSYFANDSISNLGYPPTIMEQLKALTGIDKVSMQRSIDNYGSNPYVSDNSIVNNVHRPNINITINGNADGSTLQEQIIDTLNDYYGKRLYHA